MIDLEGALKECLAEIADLIEAADDVHSTVPLVLAEISLSTTIHNLRLYQRSIEEGHEDRLKSRIP